MYDHLTNGFEKLSFNKQGYLVTNLGARQYVYHISPNKSIKVLEPRTKTHSEAEVSEFKKSRVCFSDTVHGCVSGCLLPGYTVNFNHNYLMDHLKKARTSDREYIFYLYRASTTDLDIDKVSIADMVPDNNNELIHVFDRYISGEIGYYGKVPVELMGSIKITMMSENEHLSQKHVYTIYWLPLYNSSLHKAVATFLAYNITPNDSDISSEFINEDRDLFIARYQLYKDHIRRHLKQQIANLEKYLKTDRIV